MAVQTQYTQQVPLGAAGGLYDLTSHAVDIRINGEEAGRLRFGMGVVRGDKPGENVLLPTAADTAANFEGVVLNSGTHEMDCQGDCRLFPGDSLGVMVYGRVWVRVAPDLEIEYGNPVYLCADGDHAGCFTNVSQEGKTIPVKARFIGRQGSGNIAPLELFNQARE